MEKVYQWGEFGYKQDPQEIGEYIEALQESNGDISPMMIIDVARSPDNIMHSMFEWQNDVAAEKYREAQASKILCAIKVTIVEYDIENVRAFVNIAERKGTYKTLNSVIVNKDEWDYVLANAKRDMKIFVAKYKTLKALNKVIGEMQNII